MKSLVNIVVLLSTLAMSSLVRAQAGSFLDLGNKKEVRSAVIGPPDAVRVGDGVLLRIFRFQTEPDFAYSYRLLASCRSQWLSTVFDTLVHETDKGWAPRTWQKEAKERGVELLSESIGINNWAESGFDFAPALKGRIEGICKSASSEPRNVLLPVAASDSERDGVKRVIAIVTGSAVRKESVVDVWLRTSEFVTEVRRNSRGEPMMFRGQEVTHQVANGVHAVERKVFDCKNRKMGTYHRISYKPDGSNTSQTIERSDLSLFDVAPETIGEAQLDAVCKLYGPVNP